MAKQQSYRHLPAFILILLAHENLYGAALLHAMKQEMPFFFNTDLSIIYRVLQDLESIGAVTYYWETDTSGPARKWYQITSIGFEKLAEYREDIEKRMKNFVFFMDQYEALKDKASDPKYQTDNKKSQELPAGS